MNENTSFSFCKNNLNVGWKNKDEDLDDDGEIDKSLMTDPLECFKSKEKNFKNFSSTNASVSCEEKGYCSTNSRRNSFFEIEHCNSETTGEIDMDSNSYASCNSLVGNKKIIKLEKDLNNNNIIYDHNDLTTKMDEETTKTSNLINKLYSVNSDNINNNKHKLLIKKPETSNNLLEIDETLTNSDETLQYQQISNEKLSNNNSKDYFRMVIKYDFNNQKSIRSDRTNCLTIESVSENVYFFLKFTKV